jgi:hypothetical protein
VLDGLNYELPEGARAVDAEIERITFRIEDLESFFNQLIELQRDFGIQSFRYW